jgi:hypothetical protein
MKTFREYHRLVAKRNQIISCNRSRLFGNKLQLPVPPKPVPPAVPVAYDGEGNYVGRLKDAADCPDGCRVRWE